MLPISLYCTLVNARNAIRQKAHRIKPATGENGQIHIASDGKDSIYICRRGRHNRYKKGVIAGVNRLASDYSLDVIEHLRDGVFIDCGANVGELGIWATRRGFRYIAFEPEELEARCVDLNCFGSETKAIRKALWKETTKLRFYNRSDEADSSLLPDGTNASFTEIDAVTLDEAVDIQEFKGPVIFKLEAEGAEPEVLEGAAKVLQHVDWVAVDCGFERGAEKAHTFVETNNFLTQHGFRMVAAKFKRVTALYQRVT